MQENTLTLSDQGAHRLVEVYDRERSRFLRFINRQAYSNESLDAEEILSDVFTHLLERTGLIVGIENLSAYIYRSLSNRILDRRRKPKREVSLDATNDDESPVMIAEDTRPTPDAMLEQLEMAATLQSAINKLTAKERAIFIATEIDGRSYQELAEEWDEPIGTLLSRKSRAAAKLRKILTPTWTKTINKQESK